MLRYTNIPPSVLPGRVLSRARKQSAGLFQCVLVLFVIVVSTCGPAPIILASDSSTPSQPKPQIPFPAQKLVLQGTSLPNHQNQNRQNDLVRKTYDDWKGNYLIPVKNDVGTTLMYRVSAGKSKRNKTYSEGQGYGMLLTVYMAGYDPQAQKIFDGLWLYAKMNPSRNDSRFMAYQVPISKNRRSSAFDGDCDMALALILADTQWKSSGTFNYRNEGLTLIKALLGKIIGNESNLPMLGDWVPPKGVRYNEYTHRSSDIMPAHFKIFHRVTGDPRWLEVIKRCQALVEHMQTTHSPETGLLPDFIVGSKGHPPEYRPASSRFLESIYDGDYYYNAARVPWRLGLDALLHGDPVSLIQLKRIANWAVTMSEGDPSRIGPGYKLNGKRLGNEKYVSKAYVAPFAVAAMSTIEYQNFINSAFDLCITLRQDYYEDTIGLLCLLIMTGNCWFPR